MLFYYGGSFERDILAAKHSIEKNFDTILKNVYEPFLILKRLRDAKKRAAICKKIAALFDGDFYIKVFLRKSDTQGPLRIVQACVRHPEQQPLVPHPLHG